MGIGKPVNEIDKVDLLFTGIGRGGGQGRENFVAEMDHKYGARFKHIYKGVHQETLRDLIAASRIVVAPDAPATDNYFSNRVYLTLGFGGFLLHPYCAELTKQYRDAEEIRFYHSRQHLHELIAFYLPRPDVRQAIATAGLKRTLDEHMYYHRVKTLVEVVKRRLLNKDGD